MCKRERDVPIRFSLWKRAERLRVSSLMWNLVSVGGLVGSRQVEADDSIPGTAKTRRAAVAQGSQLWYRCLTGAEKD